MGVLIFLLGMLLIGILANKLIFPPAEPSYPQEIPIDVPKMPACTNESALKSNEDSAFVSSGTAVRIEFDSIQSLQGIWGAFSLDAEFDITSPYNAALKTYTRTIWWSGDLTSTMEQATPYLEASFETEDKYLHQWISGRANMTVVFPVRSNQQNPGSVLPTWTNEHKPVERNISFYVVTPEEAKMIEAHKSWESYMSKRFDPMGLLVGAVFALIGALLILSARYTWKNRNAAHSSVSTFSPRSLVA